MRGHRGSHGGYEGVGGLGVLLVIMVIAVYVMPLVGVYVLITGKNENSKLLGGALTVVGIILWIALGIH